MPGKPPGGLPSERSASWVPWIVALAVLAVYGRALGRFFTSEDFLLVRFLDEHPPWRGLRSLFAAPWLDISVVKFWRPVSTLLYGVEIAAFGARPFGYNLTHVLVHALNAVLVWNIARRLDPGRFAPLAAAFLFALHPLHPNAVVFGASFATLFAATFFLAAVLAWQREARLLALGMFGLALGSYEAAVVLPAVIVAWEILLSRDRRRLVWTLPFFVLLALYFLLRRSLFGVFVGGYEEQGRSLLAPQVGRLLRDLTMSIHQIHVPAWDRWPHPVAVGAVMALVIGLPILLVAFGRSQTGWVRSWLFGWIWTLVCFAPFAFRPVVPGNGRYWYLASAGVALSLAVLAREVWESRGRWLAPAALVLLGLFWGVLLQRHLTVSLQAGETARAIQGELVRTDARFLTRHPDFLTNEIGTPIAGVLRYGVWDAVHPPFVEDAIEVLPLPPLSDSEFLPVYRGASGRRVHAWDSRAGKIREITPPQDGPADIQVIAPAEGAVLDPGRDQLVVAVPSGAVRFRLIVVTRGNSTVIDLGPGTIQGGALRASLPRDFCRSMDHLYGGEQFWWIEARDGAGALVGFTPMRSFRVQP
ncbi:MAG TPA: hypothetical protein VJ885_07205 [Thermoanaerobaculia bacterium]|nr:hypothetical protein [Thermoanaerobaculia bacterium]